MIRVRTMNRENFRDNCGRLWDLAFEQFRPNIVVGIRSGGWWVGEAMKMARTPANVEFLPLTCRRPSTGNKDKSRLFRLLLKILPYFILNSLRFIEYYLITLPRCRAAWKHGGTRGQIPDTAETAAIAAAVSRLGTPARILVVDDSLDSGGTMLNVAQILRNMLPSNSQLRFAAFTVLGPKPIIDADFALYRSINFRFPWSYDFHG